jgi:hypothetical protein
MELRLQPRKRRQDVPLKHCYPTTSPQGVKTQKSIIDRARYNWKWRISEKRIIDI